MLSYRKLAMRVLGRPLHTGDSGSPRPASQRAAAFILTAIMLTSLTAPAFAKTWCIEDGNITVKAGDTGNDVTQKGETTYGDTDTIITNQNKDIASSNTVTIETNDKNDKVEVTLKDVNINVGSDSGSALTSNGDVTLTLKGDNSLTGGNGGSGISSNGSLTITGGENDSLTAKGGSGADGSGGDGIHSGSLTIYGGTVNANGGNCGDGNYSDGGSGIRISSRSLTIYDGKVTANGGNGGSGGGNGGDGITSNGGVTISSGSTVTANGGRGEDGSGGSGISNGGSLTVSGGTVTAKGGNGDSKDGYGGDGIRSGGGVTISGGTVTATGGKSGSGDYSNGGNGISSSGSLSISGGTVTATAGSSSGSYGRDGITTSSSLTISGGTVTANGGSGSYRGGSGISSSDIELSGSLELTAKAGSPNGKALSQRGYELDLDTIKDKLGPGAKVTATDADGKVIDQVSSPRPVEPEGPVIPEESSSSSDSGSSTPSADGGSATPSAPASPLPGLTVTDKDGQRISYTSIRGNNVLSIRVGRFTASLRASLATLRQLRAEGIDTITFQTILCSTTLSVDELLAMGGEDAEAVLTHRFIVSSLTVG